MKKYISILNVVLLICVSGSSFALQPPQTVRAANKTQAQYDDSQAIAYIGRSGIVWLENSDGSNRKQLTSDGGYEELAWAPDGQHLALSKGLDDSYRRPLYIQDMTGNPAKKISDGVFALAWNAQGSRIAYIADQIYVYDVKNELVEKAIPMVGGITGTSADYWDSSTAKIFWHISGDNLIYYSARTNGIHQVSMNTLTDTLLFVPSESDEIGKIIRQLAYAPLTGYFFGWDHSSQAYGIPLLITPTGELIPLEGAGENDTFGIPTIAEWSSDGRYVTYNNVDYLGGQVFIVEVNPYSLETTNAIGLNPQWSPDNKSIAFTTEKGGLSLLDVGNQSVTDLLPKVSDSYLTESCGIDACGGYFATAANQPRWSPDGNSILLPFKVGFFIYDLDSKKPRFVDGGLGPQWQPNREFSVSIISNLAVQPVNADGTVDSYPIVLSWEVESTDQISEFDVRMSDAPLDDASWNNARVINDIPTPGNTIEVTIPLSVTDLHKRLYFGVRTKNLDGEWSPVSNVVEYIDSGFRPNINGYNFENGQEDWGVYPRDPITLEDFTEQDFYQMFNESSKILGISNICIPLTDNGENCILWPEYKQWVNSTNLDISKNGRCFGMAGTSAMIYENPLLISNLGQGFDKVYDDNVNSNVANVRRYITNFHIKQGAYPYINYRGEYLENVESGGLSFVLNDIQESIISGESMFLVYGGASGAHAVVPISVVIRPNGTIMIYTYDNGVKYEDGIEDGISEFEIFPDGSWKDSSKLCEGIFTCNLRDGELFLVKTKALEGTQLLPQFSTSNIVIRPTAGYGAILITDSNGEQIGTVDGVYINEISGANINPTVFGNELIRSEPTYLLPADGQYTIQFNYIPGVVDPVSISQFGADYAIAIENINFPNGFGDLAELSSDGKQIRYEAPNGQVLDMQITARIENSGYLYQFTNISIESGEELVIEKSTSVADVTLSPVPNNPFDLTIKRLDSTGEKAFIHKAVQMIDAKSIVFDVEDWNGRGALNVKVDTDGDGEYEEVVKLSNEANAVTDITSRLNFGFILCGIGFLLFIAGAVGLFVIRRRKVSA